MKYFRIRFLPLWVLAVAVLVLNCLTEWSGDALDYGFVFAPDGSDAVPEDHVASLRDIFISQYNHYFWVNGRFFLHCIVQLFCGILGKYVFAACNAAVWFFVPVLLLKAANVRLTFRTATAAAALTPLLFYYLGADPPMQINYVWMSALCLVFLILFFRNSRATPWACLGLALLGFLTGEGNEAFSFVTGICMLAYALNNRFRLSTSQWICGFAFVVGTAVLVAAPGIRLRAGEQLSGAETLWLNRLETAIPAFAVPALFCIVAIFTRRCHKKRKDMMPPYALWAGAAGAVLLWFLVKGVSGERILIPGNLMLAILILRRLRDDGVTRWGTALFSLAGAAGLAAMYWADLDRSAMIGRIYDGYDTSQDGKVYIPNEDYARHGVHFIRRKTSLEREARYRYGKDLPLEIRPKAMRNVSVSAASDSLIQIDRQSWVVYRAKGSAGRFIVKKTLLPGLLDRPTADRVIDPEEDYELLIDTAGSHITAFYTNPRPYIRADVQHE